MNREVPNVPETTTALKQSKQFDFDFVSSRRPFRKESVS